MISIAGRPMSTARPHGEVRNRQHRTSVPGGHRDLRNNGPNG